MKLLYDEFDRRFYVCSEPNENGIYVREYEYTGERLYSRSYEDIISPEWHGDNVIAEMVYDETEEGFIKDDEKDTKNKLPKKGMLVRVDENDRPFYFSHDNDIYYKIYLDSDAIEQHSDNSFLNGAGFIQVHEYEKYDIILEKPPSIALKKTYDFPPLTREELYPEPLGYDEVTRYDYTLGEIVNDKPSLNLPEIIRMVQERYIVRIEDDWFEYDTISQIYKPRDKSDIHDELTFILKNAPNTPYPISEGVARNMMHVVHRNATMRNLNELTEKKYPQVYEKIQKDYVGSLVRFSNCILNLSNMKILPYTPHFFTKAKYKAVFNPNIQDHPVREIYENIIPDEDTLRFFFEAVGHTIFNPSMNPPMIMLLYGPGETGKSALVETIREIIGEDNVSNLNLDQLSSQFGPIDLVGKQMNICTETGNKGFKSMFGGGVNGDLLKQLAEGSPTTFDRKNRGSVTVRNTAKMWFVSNTLPNFGDTSSGMYRRLFIIPCWEVQKWSDQIHTRMKERDALSWLVNEALKGYLRLINRKEGFKESDRMKEELKHYRMQDNFTDYLMEKHGLEQHEDIRDFLDGQVATDLHREYDIFTRDSGGMPMSRKNLVTRIRTEYRMSYKKENYIGDSSGLRTSGMVFRKI